MSSMTCLEDSLSLSLFLSLSLSLTHTHTHTPLLYLSEFWLTYLTRLPWSLWPEVLFFCFFSFGLLSEVMKLLIFYPVKTFLL